MAILGYWHEAGQLDLLVIQPELIMKHFETVKVPEHTKEKLTHVTCDICKEKIEKNNFDATETTVEMIKGDMYPEGGSGERIDYDICPNCFINELIPFLESKGAGRDWMDWDY